MGDWQGKQVLIVGLGRTGQAAARYLAAKSARVRVTDSADSPALQSAAMALRDDGIQVETGGHSPGILDGVDSIVLSPGVPTSIPLLQEAASRSIPVMSELEAVWQDAPAPIAAVTGTNGKTTTTALLHHILTESGLKSVLCGNNDIPLAAALAKGNKPDWFVLEISSYQLESAHTFRPRVAAVLNVTPDHPRHGTLQQYADVKARIFQAQRVGDVAILNCDDALTAAMAAPKAVTVLRFGLDPTAPADAHVQRGEVFFRDEPILPVDDLPLGGSHNRANVLAAVAMAMAMGINPEAIARGIRSFKGVPHRIELVATIDGVPCYNDSKSTNIDSLRVALDSFRQPVVLIAGGRGKDSDYRVLEPLIRVRVGSLVLIGEDGPKMAEAWGGDVPWQAAGSMDEAVALALDAAAPGQVLLLSPGCASFDWYNNFEERGEDFRACVTRRAAAQPDGKEPIHGA